MIARDDDPFFTKQPDSVALANGIHHFQKLSGEALASLVAPSPIALVQDNDF